MNDVDDGPQSSRREALKKIALSTGAVTTLPILGQAAAGNAKNLSRLTTVAQSPSTDSVPTWKPTFFDEHQNETVVALTELIIPETDTPGAKGALVNRYLDMALREEEPALRKSFFAGLGWIDARSMKLYGKLFVQISPKEQAALLTPLADTENRNPEDQPGVEFFQEIKDLTIFAYYTSRVGMEQELEYGGDEYHTEFPGACTHPEHQT